MTVRMEPAFDTRAFRHALGPFPTGVCVVTARVDGHPVGVGGPALLREHALTELPTSEEWRDEGAIVLHVLVDGRVAGAFGVRGEVRITTYTEQPMSLLAYGALLDQRGAVALELTSAREAKGGVIARARQITTKEQADALRGLFLHIDRAALPPPEEDEFYLSDLVGLVAVAPDGSALGKVKSVQDFGAGDLLEIEPPAGASWYAPFTREVVPTVDIAAGRVVVDRPAEVSERD